MEKHTLGFRALFKFGRHKRRRTVDQVTEYATVFGPLSSYVGMLQGQENYLVYGQVQGDCDIEGTLVLGEGGRWRGNIRAVNVVIAGMVEGDIEATAKVELARSAEVQGKITSPVVAIARGAVYGGRLRMTKTMQVVRYEDRRGTPEQEKENE